MPSGRISLRAALNSARGNHPLHWYASIFLLTNLGQGVFYGLVFLYVSSVLGLAAAFVWVLLADAVVTLAAIPLWYALVRALEEHRAWALRSEEHTSELQSLMRSSYAVFCLKNKIIHKATRHHKREKTLYT